MGTSLSPVSVKALVQSLPCPQVGGEADWLEESERWASCGDYLWKTSKGERQIVFVTGEPGIGKTALIDEFERQTATDVLPIRMARGQCIEGYGGKEAYYPILQALSTLCGSSGREHIVQILAAQAPTWFVQFPALVKRAQRESLQREIMGATRERMLREIGEAMEIITAESPLLLVLEDLQWVDPSTVDLISSLARGRGAAKLMIIGTYRPVDLALSDHPLKSVKQDLLVHQLCHEIGLAPLGEAAVAEYLAAGSAEADLPIGLAGLLHRHTEGNPLFMIAALELMTERNFISRGNGRWQIQVPLEEIDLGVPENLRQMIEAQIERLTEEQQKALEVASVTGASFASSVSAAAGNLDSETFQEICESVSRRHHMVRVVADQQFPDGIVSPRYEFVHALYREVFYQRLSPGRRMKLHGKIGEFLEVMFRDHLSEAAAELAHHFEKASDWPRAVKYLRLSAETAARRFAHRETAEALQRSLELLNKLPEAARAASEIEILAELAAVYAVSFETLARAVETYEALASTAARYGLIDDELRALVDMAYPLAWISSQRCTEVVGRALAVGEQKRDALERAKAQADDLVRHMGAAPLSSKDAENCRIALADIRTGGDRMVLASLLSDQGMSECDPLDCWAAVTFTSERGRCRYMHLLLAGEWTEALREVEAARAMVGRNRECDHTPTLNLCQAWVHLFAMDFSGVIAICEPIFALPKETLHSATRRFCQVLAGSAEMALGNHERALQHLLAAREEMASHMVIWDWYWRMALESSLTETWLRKRDLAKARLHAEVFVNVTLASGDRTWQALAWDANARVAMAEGNLQRAQECIVKAAATVENYDVPIGAWRVHATAAELHWSTGNTMLAQRFQELSQTIVVKLASSLEGPLRQSFLSGSSASKVAVHG